MNLIQTGALAAWVAIAAPAAGLAAQPVRDPVHAVETGLRPAVEIVGQPPVRWTMQERMAFYHVPAVSIAVIRDGKVAWAKAWGVLQAGSPERADPETMFSVGSVSKVGAATVTLRLVDAGKLDLDRDVREDLVRWRLPETALSQGRPVTLRQILSHTAGFTVSGFPDFQPGQPLPSEIDTLEGRAPSVVGPVTFAWSPGASAHYSGGGVTVEQVIVEDRTGMTFAQAAKTWLLDPLRLTRSTYEQPLPETWRNVAKAHGPDGRPRALPRGWESMPETAASGLWSTPTEYARLVIALIQSYQGKSGALLSQGLARQMMTPVGPSQVGLGPFLDGHGLTRRFSHTGSNDSYKAYFEGDLATGDGVVIFTNSASAGPIREEVRRAVAAAEGWDVTGVAKVPPFRLSAAEMDELAGSYRVTGDRGVLGGRMSIEGPPEAFGVMVENGRLWAQTVGRGTKEELVPEGPTQFVSTADSARRFEFVRGVDGRIDSLILRVDDAALSLARAR
ncbi:serine hydrolase domain-containing protein [Phenylobacterium aquaticum]|uniref:serine hydrolase domain-containing protein n=1 Tax=Phenylobacterium aquaticum TaxID=1763816 RepID=UPI001F5C7407|nr:serine hydrolase domain-containing protein [Phenylobacterium aquaticum]MCI3131172.1 beta-lactamase family protein [Phenylobacterium aquaticum]